MTKGNFLSVFVGNLFRTLSSSNAFTALQTFSNGIDMDSSEISEVNYLQPVLDAENETSNTLDSLGHITSTKRLVILDTYLSAVTDNFTEDTSLSQNHIIERIYRTRHASRDITLIDDGFFDYTFNLAGDFTLTDPADTIMLSGEDYNVELAWTELSRNTNLT